MQYLRLGSGKKIERSMRNLAVLILVLFVQISFGQYLEERENVASRFRPGVFWYYSGFKPYEPEKLRKYDRVIVDVVYNDWNGDLKPFNGPWSSIGFNTSFMFDKPLTKANTVALGIGIGFSHYNNRTEGIFTSDYKLGTTTFGTIADSLNIQSNKYTANYLEIPLEFRLRTKGFKHFKFFIGGKFGYQLNSYSKKKIKIEGNTYRTKENIFVDNNRLRYGATVRIGIRNWSLYGAYYFSDLFKSAESTKLNPLSMGISISLF